MRLVFMGTPEFAVASLDILFTNGYDIAAVVTAPDRPAGRGQQLHQSAVKKYALTKGLKVLQPQKLRDESFIKELRDLKAQLQVVVAFRMLPEEVWNMPPYGTYNLHASLLPRYRGAAPINWAIINGEKETGVTTFKLKHEIDTGNILYSEKVDIPATYNAGELHDVLKIKGCALVLKTVKEIENKGGQVQFTIQDESKASHAPKIFKEDCRIKWDKKASEIHNLVRGLSPNPGAFTMYTTPEEELSLKIFSCEYSETMHSEAHGSVLIENTGAFKIFCGVGFITVKELQMQGKKRMNADDFLRGFRFKTGTILR
jgi:methionyl-tRNA formyltransferase